MNIRLKLFSGLMEYLPPRAEGNTVAMKVEAGTSAHQLVDGQGIPREEAAVVMVNGEFLAPENRDDPLAEGDTVSVWPSIQGG